MIKCLLYLAILLNVYNNFNVQAEECEVCVGFLKKVESAIRDWKVESKESKLSQEIIKKILLKNCEAARDKEERFCYAIGGVKQAPTSIIKEITLPLSFPKPVDKICQDLKKKDSQLCELKYDKPIDWDNLDLSKMRVKQLKELLTKLGDSCKGCAEKSDYVQRINELKPKHKSEL